jgi:hypothetical protein
MFLDENVSSHSTCRPPRREARPRRVRRALPGAVGSGPAGHPAPPRRCRTAGGVGARPRLPSAPALGVEASGVPARVRRGGARAAWWRASGRAAEWSIARSPPRCRRSWPPPSGYGRSPAAARAAPAPAARKRGELSRVRARARSAVRATSAAAPLGVVRRRGSGGPTSAPACLCSSRIVLKGFALQRPEPAVAVEGSHGLFESHGHLMTAYRPPCGAVRTSPSTRAPTETCGRVDPERTSPSREPMTRTTIRSGLTRPPRTLTPRRRGP